MEIFNYTFEDLIELGSRMTIGEWIFIFVCIGTLLGLGALINS